jgi:hypothetical protein
MSMSRRRLPTWTGDALHLKMPRAIILFLGLSLSLSSLIAVVSGAVAQQLLAGLCPAGPNPFNLR